VVVGYSFPPSDTYMKYFFASALVDNIDLPRLSVVDPYADQIVDRLRSSDYGTHFKQLLAPVSAPWQDSKFRICD
jgi:hypothetical protein